VWLHAPLWANGGMCLLPLLCGRIFLVGLCIASVGKLGVNPSAFFFALLRILSIVSICLSVKMPIWVACYFDLSSYSITSFLRLGYSSLFVRTLAIFLMSVVMCLT
jgi:hypothetical protein